MCAGLVHSINSMWNKVYLLKYACSSFGNDYDTVDLLYQGRSKNEQIANRIDGDAFVVVCKT